MATEHFQPPSEDTLPALNPPGYWWRQLDDIVRPVADEALRQLKKSDARQPSGVRYSSRAPG